MVHKIWLDICSFLAPFLTLPGCPPCSISLFLHGRHQVVFGRLFLLLPSGVHHRTTTQSLDRSLLSTRATHGRLFHITSSLILSVSTSSRNLTLVICCCLFWKSSRKLRKAAVARATSFAYLWVSPPSLAAFAPRNLNRSTSSAGLFPIAYGSTHLLFSLMYSHFCAFSFSTTRWTFSARMFVCDCRCSNLDETSAISSAQI